jgi:hypothetical protein
VSITPLVILDDDTYFSWGPTSNQLDQAIISLHPQWQHFRQVVFTDPWTVGDVYEQAAFCGEGCGVNPAILLIALSMRLQWQIPPDGDLDLRAQQAARELYHYYALHYTEETIRQAYPQIGNASTYSLYRFFGKDLAKVRAWCETYQNMFGSEYALRP